ncbi:InlB B-repeat-containing protein [Candidatus Xianfuyuplasma coldseepsis]|uniref:Transporter substrate-binding domain-containing protein n=1 Tax=Candidatus Xianfuyuplasma coldseepsis TaxID=2782163 RepID=A0A7L7KQY9_9MOLU|nr:transporter substrate-binding domain-containing protein [Xianfuyuplasma coldseepsis]QMS85143.1 transporter substrate-binding domain-containing protein [Xianfuyuplasma coldseepsis]
MMKIFSMLGIVLLVFLFVGCSTPEVEPIEFTVTFETDGGTDIGPISVTDGRSVAEPTVPQKEGYTFEGWFTDSTLNSSYDFSNAVVGDLTLHAKWVANVVYHVVTFVNVDETVIDTQTLEQGTEIVFPDNPVQSGCTFDGWILDEETITSLTLVEDTTLQAKYTCSEALKVGMDLRYPPFETVTLNQVPEGISVDIAYAFGEYIGRQIEIVNMDFGSLIAAVNSGDIDIIIASMSITESREELVDFSDPYFYFKLISLVNKDFATTNGITSSSTIEDIVAIEDVNFVGIASQVSVTIPESYGKNVTETTDLSTAIESVVQGTADVLIMSANPIVNGHNANPDDTIIVWDAFLSAAIGMAVQEGNTILLNQANNFIATFSDIGGLYDQLSEKWDDAILDELGEYGLEFYINE